MLTGTALVNFPLLLSADALLLVAGHLPRHHSQLCGGVPRRGAGGKEADGYILLEVSYSSVCWLIESQDNRVSVGGEGAE